MLWLCGTGPLGFEPKGSRNYRAGIPPTAFGLKTAFYGQHHNDIYFRSLETSGFFSISSLICDLSNISLNDEAPVFCKYILSDHQSVPKKGEVSVEGG